MDEVKNVEKKTQKRGKEHPDDRVLNIYIPKETHKKLKMYSLSVEKTVKDVSIEALNEFLKDKEVKGYKAEG